jgi:type I restriction enzyme, S subunit
MEVKPGYKQTEAGVIPVDWVEMSVHEFAAIKTGPFGTLLKAAEYSQGDGVPLISVGEIRQGFLKISDHTPCISEAITRRLPQYVLRKGDIVFGRKGGVDRSALIEQSQKGWFLGSDGISIRPTQDCNHKYVALQLQSARVQGWLLHNAIGTTMPSLNQEILRNVVIAFPPTKAEQEAIAAALSDVDALIAALDRLIAKKRDIKQAAKQELLTGKKRLPGFADENRYKQTEIGLIPEDWNYKPIGNEIDLLTGFPFPSDQYAISGIRLLRGSNVKRGVTDWSDDIMKFWTKVTPDLKSYLLSEGDLVVAMDGSLVGRSYARLIKADLPALLLQRVARIRSQRIDTGYLNEFVGSDLFVKYCDSVKTVTAIPHISSHDIRNFSIPIPSTINEQRAIASALSDMDAEIAALDARREKTRALKQGMMQELLTGRIRLA